MQSFQMQRHLHGTEEPSDWVKRWSHLIEPGGHVLDVASGYGRHAYYFYERGHHVTVIDRSLEAITSIAIPALSCTKIVADIEHGAWPLAQHTFDAVVATNYLWRPLLPTLLASVAVGGVLIYETFAIGNETVGKPSRPDFLLQSGELLQVCCGLNVVAYESGFVYSTAHAPARFVQRIAAVRQSALSPLPMRYLLAAS